MLSSGATALGTKRPCSDAGLTTDGRTQVPSSLKQGQLPPSPHRFVSQNGFVKALNTVPGMGELNKWRLLVFKEWVL